MRTPLILSIGLLIAACAAPASEESSTSEAPLSTFEETQKLYNAKKGDLVFGAFPVTATGSFMTFTFWANQGETVQLHIDGAPSFQVLRVKGIDHCVDGEWSVESTSETTSVGGAVGATDATIEVERSGTHFVVIGSPTATASNTVRISSSVRRRPATKNVRAISMYEARTCAVLENGDAKCWGTTKSEWERQPRPGASMSSMGAALAKVPLPAKAVDVLLTGPGKYTTTELLLEDGSVWSSLEDAPLQKIALAGKARKLAEHCAWLVDDSVQCWAWDTGTPKPARRFSKPIKNVAAGWDSCVLLEGDELACDSAPTTVKLQLEKDEHALDIAGTPFATCILTNKAVRCGKWDGGVQSFDGNTWRAAVPAGRLLRFTMSEAWSPFLLTTDGTYGMVDGGDWVGSTLPNARWDQRANNLLVQSTQATGLTSNDSAARVTQCAIVEGGVVKCAGGWNVGQLGLGDCIDRDLPEQLGANLPGLLLE